MSNPPNPAASSSSAAPRKRRVGDPVRIAPFPDLVALFESRDELADGGEDGNSAAMDGEKDGDGAELDDANDAIDNAVDAFHRRIPVPSGLCDVGGRLTAPREFHTRAPGAKAAWHARIGPVVAAQHRAFALLWMWPELTRAAYQPDAYNQIEEFLAVHDSIADLIDDGAPFTAQHPVNKKPAVLD